MAITMLSFISDIEDLRTISFLKDIKIKSREAALEALLSHKDINEKDFLKILLCTDFSINFRKLALEYISEIKDTKKTEEKLNKIIESLSKEDVLYNLILKKLQAWHGIYR